jgi:hypothetical protein
MLTLRRESFWSEREAKTASSIGVTSEGLETVHREADTYT